MKNRLVFLLLVFLIAAVAALIPMLRPITASDIAPLALGALAMLIFCIFFGMRNNVQDAAAYSVFEESEERYRQMFENNTLPAYVVDPEDGRIVEANAEASRFWGYSPQELRGMSMTEIIVESPEEVIEFARQAKHSAGYRSEWRHRLKSGVIRNIEVYTGQLKYRGKHLLFSVAHDVTDRKKLETDLKQQLHLTHALLEAIPNPVFFKDAEGRYLGCNKAFETFLGTTTEALLGKSVFDLSPPDLAAKYHTMDAALFNSPGVQVYESSVKAPDGSLRAVVFHKATFNNKDGKLAGLIGSILDITDRKQAEQALQKSESTLKQILDLLPVGVFVSDVNGSITMINPAGRQIGGFMHMIGVDADQGGSTALHASDTRLVTRDRDILAALAEGKVTRDQEFQIQGSDGSRRIIRSSSMPLRDVHQTIIGAISVKVDVTDLKTTEQALRVAYEELEARVQERTAELRNANRALQQRERAIESSLHAVIIANATGPEYQIEYVNPAFERITSYTPDEVIGKSWPGLLSGINADRAGLLEISAALREQQEGSTILRAERKNGTSYWSHLYIAPVKSESGEVTHFVSAQYDITDIKRYQAQLEHQATHDVLTGLPNRSLLYDRLNQAIAFAARDNHPVWVMFVDLDRFKFINDSFGHQVGDKVLQTVSARLKTATRQTDTVARLGGDEFVIVLGGSTESPSAAWGSQRVMETIAEPIIIEGQNFFLTCSVGIAVYPTDGVVADILVDHADIAMYRAKQQGRNNLQFYTSAMNEGVLERLQVESALHHALERREFVLHYQPQVDLKTGCIVGMEALIRWEHPELGMVPPGRFISLSEENGSIVPIGKWVLRSACMQAKLWQRAGFGDLCIAVNLSARQFSRRDLVQSVAAVLEETGLSPHLLELELTESLLMTDVETAIATMQELKALGVALSIDDFGTGYSSLSYLKRFPIDILKIDQSFVRDITLDPGDAVIVMSIIALAHNLKLHVIAEGVETKEQLAYLRHHRCDAIQGHYFSRPLPADEIEKILRQGKDMKAELNDPAMTVM
jgi:diguanylate cyclase (GGDEF)-like protein/PAS domain S-box-containing protein